MNPLGIPLYLLDILDLLTPEDIDFALEFWPIGVEHVPTAGGVKRKRRHEVEDLLDLHAPYWIICGHQRGSGECKRCAIPIGGSKRWKK